MSSFDQDSEIAQLRSYGVPSALFSGRWSEPATDERTRLLVQSASA